MAAFDAPRPAWARKVAAEAKRDWKERHRGEGPSWRDFYVARVRSEGKVQAGCGDAKTDEERRYQAMYKGTCFVCGGKWKEGDWIFWDKEKKRGRHAPSGWKKPDAT